ncbi:MAG: hypothetical protein QMD77_04885, partial [Patescibacteria group bacterium]|nr:hypothetical protein [Patescibacteria group bacterium]
MSQKRHKNKTIFERELEIAADFFKTLSTRKRPSGNGWSFSRRNAKDDAKKRLEKTRRKLEELYQQKTKGAGRNVNFKWPNFNTEEKTQALNNILEDETKKPKEKITVAAQEIQKAGEEKKFAALEENDSRLISISDAAKISKYKREYLGYSIRQKKLWAQKVNGAWMTTKEWVDKFEKEAAEKKEKVKKDLSKKMGEGIGLVAAIEETVGEMENLKRSLKEKKKELQKIFAAQKIARPVAALLLLVVFAVVANVTKADFASWSDWGTKKAYESYNAAVNGASKIVKNVDGDAAENILKIRVGVEKFAGIAQNVFRRDKIKQFEKNSKLNLTGDDGNREEIAGVEAPDFSSSQEMVSESDGARGKVLAVADVAMAELINIGDVEVSAYLMDADNQQILNGEYEVRFGIYSTDRAETDPYPSDTDQASRVWEETQKVSIQNGLLTAYLGQIAPIPTSFDFAAGNYYLGIRIGEDAEMVPRKRIGAVPLARTAMNAQSLSGYAV